MLRKTLEPAAARKPLPSNFNSCNQMAGLYDLGETLGKGHYAVVKAARHVFTGEKVAVKVIEKCKLGVNHQKALLKEVLCMKLVQHPHVVRLYEVIDTSSKLYLVLELGHGDLYDLIQRQQGGLSEEVAKKYFRQILSAVSYCHKLHVVHRDLKPENVVYFPTAGGGEVKLTDFGFSNNYSPGVKLDTSCGSLAYSAPEILLGDAYDAPAVDIWSLGVILFMLVCGRPPFQEANDSETLTMIMDVKYSVPSTVSPSCVSLIKSMLVRGPEKRAKLEEIETHEWVVGGGGGGEGAVPLIVDHRLTGEERRLIIQQMESGHIATQEQILESLETSAYNHITSTFYLLAEKFLRERPSVYPGTSSALTSSLESLHERRKTSIGGHSHSGNSDTDDGLMSESEADSLAPLDLEMKNASESTSKAVKSKNSHRLSSTLSSSSLGDIDKGAGLPVVQETEDGVVRGEEDDNAGPLPSSTHHRRRAPFTHRRVMLPQRSASCSSSEDEDSEKKKRGGRHKAVKKHVGGSGECSTSSSSTNRKLFDDESSDEQGSGTRGMNFNSLSITHSANESTSTSRGGDDNEKKGEPPPPTTTPQDSTKNEKGEEKLNEVETVVEIKCGDEEEEDDGTTTDENFEGGGGIGGESRMSDEFLLRPPLRKFSGYSSDPDRHSCSDLAYAIEVPSHTHIDGRGVGVGGGGGESKGNSGLSLAKKGKKLFFSWFFLKRKKKSGGRESVGESVGIYKTKSFAELKLRSAGPRNLSSTTGAGPTNSTDVNMNL